MEFFTQEKALRIASRKAKKQGVEWHVFEEGDGYDFGNDEDCDTYYAGIDPIATCSPDGLVHWNK